MLAEAARRERGFGEKGTENDAVLPLSPRAPDQKNTASPSVISGPEKGTARSKVRWEAA